MTMTDQAWSNGSMEALGRVKTIISTYRDWAFEQHKEFLANENLLLAYDMDSRCVAASQLLGKLNGLIETYSQQPEETK